MTAQRFWVNDETRYARVTMHDDFAHEAQAAGFREVTAEEWDTFRAESRLKWPGLFEKKGSR